MRCQLLLVLLLAQPAHGQTVIDGDTIQIGYTRYRLWGIDAPESRQHCADGWAAGAASTEAMHGFVAGKVVVCHERARDRWGRVVALCRAANLDLSKLMVRAGLALAYTRYSSDYVADEAAARAERLGVHGHQGCLPPWQWRQQPTPMQR